MFTFLVWVFSRNYDLGLFSVQHVSFCLHTGATNAFSATFQSKGNWKKWTILPWEVWSATVTNLRAVRWGSYSQSCFQNYILLMLSVFLLFVDFTSLFLALLPLVFPVIYAHCPLYKNESWDQAAVLKSQKYVEREKSPDVCLNARAINEKVTFLWFLFRPRHLYLQISKSWGIEYFPPRWKTSQWSPMFWIGKYTSYWLICDVGNNSNLLGPRPWNTGNPLWCFCSAPSLLALHPISTLRLEINPGDLQFTVGSNNCKHVTCYKFYMFSKEIAC